MGLSGIGINEENHIVNGSRIAWLIDDSIGAILSVPFCTLPFCPKTIRLTCLNYILTITMYFIVLWEIFSNQNNSHTYSIVPRQPVYGHFVYDTSSTDISSTTVYQRIAQLYIQLLFQQIIIFINSNFYLFCDSFLSIPLPLTLW